MIETEHPELVILGKWNVRILTPEWFFEEMEFLEKRDEIPLEVHLESGALRFTINDVTINPFPDRLVFFLKHKSGENNKLLTKMALRTVELLCHTPIYAIGHNISYEVENPNKAYFLDHDVISKVERNYNKINEHSNSTLITSELKHSVLFKEFILNVMYTTKRDKYFIGLNFHYDIEKTGKEATIKKAVEAFNNNIDSSEHIKNCLLENL